MSDDKNLPAPVDGPGREGQIVIYMPNLKVVHEKLFVEEGPPKQHLKTTLAIMGTVLAVILGASFPIILKVAGAVGIYGCVHAAVYFLFFRPEDKSEYY